MQYRLIINTGKAHTHSEIATSVEMLQSAVKFHLEVGHTIVEVQSRECVDWNKGWAGWQNT